ncbi:type II toxin-antitoxin system RelB family antitoxin [Schaalia turicensis]|uniref:type II toxin-antitoxin system RelB family antitoxin n=1 Tax=Schaalia turicensis TaxID=131111 RepID=UPI001FAFD65E|nr:antitoxin [Schaalia turicensis]
MIRRKHLGGVLATSVVALRILQDLAGRYDHLASMTGRTKTYYLTQALAESIDRLEYEYGLMQKVEDWRAGRLETASLDELEATLVEVRD